MIRLLEAFVPEQSPESTEKTARQPGLLLYEYTKNRAHPVYFVIKGAISKERVTPSQLAEKGTGGEVDDIVAYCANASPEIYDTITTCLDRGSLFIDLGTGAAWRPDGPDAEPETMKLVEALGTIIAFPKKYVDSPGSSEIVSVILGAGKGTRMRSRDLHKVCFPIAGRPAINRLLDQLEQVGVSQHIIVVGEKGQQVVREVSDVRDNVTFVFQINQNGTGNAAKQAAYLLSHQGFTGRVLVVPGDKVIEKDALVRLFETFDTGGADGVIMTDEKKYWPDAGRIVFNRSGQPVDIIEKCDIRKLIEKKDLRYTVLDNGETYDLTGRELEETTPQTNAAVYLFSWDAFAGSVFKISSDNAQKEEYFTEVFRILARDRSRSWTIASTPVRNRHEVMSFNNPEEFLKIEEYYGRKESNIPAPKSLLERIDKKARVKALRPVGEWLRIIDEFGPAAKKTFRKLYGDDESILQERRAVYRQTLLKFIRVYGKNNSVIIARSPGHVNLMGRHVEHRGGFTNYMTINREAILAAGIREDDTVAIHNVDSQRFRPRSFSIGHELSLLPWDEWLHMIQSRTVIDMIHASRTDWSNYFKAASLRLQEKFKDRLLFGFNGVLSGQIPAAAGLSSSSAVVVSAAEALTFINGLSLVPKDFVDLCGEGEWFVGAGAAGGDYAAMKYGEKGSVIHMGFHEVRIEEVIPFPRNYRVIILLSHQDTKKSESSMQIYNERVAAYELAHELVKLSYPGFRDRLSYFRDITAVNFGLEPWGIYEILLALPERISRKEAMKLFPRDRKKELERIFSTHRDPAGGYAVRKVALFGLAEIARARQFARLLKERDMKAAGRLMTVSHDGDRVSMANESGERSPYVNEVSNMLLVTLKKKLTGGDSLASLHLQPGGYGCSTELIDEMVDIATGIDGVAGAQISGAGLGGCIMAMVREDAVEPFRQTMAASFYARHNLAPEVIVSAPVAGSGIVTV